MLGLDVYFLQFYLMAVNSDEPLFIPVVWILMGLNHKDPESDIRAERSEKQKSATKVHTSTKCSDLTGQDSVSVNPQPWDPVFSRLIFVQPYLRLPLSLEREGNVNILQIYEGFISTIFVVLMKYHN